MKLIKKIITSSFLLLLLSKGSASEYYCPEIPEKISVGGYLNKEWYVWPFNEEMSIWNSIYYKIVKEEYKIKMWNSYPNGQYQTRNGVTNNFIACCRLIKNRNKRICSFRVVKEKNCHPILKRNPSIKFICIDNLNDK